MLEPSLTYILNNLIHRRNELLEVHRDQIKDTLNKWITNSRDFGFIKILPDGFKAYEPREPRIKFYNEAKEHLKSGYNKKPYNAWDLWEKIIAKWEGEKIRVKTLWFAFECIVKNEINSLDIIMGNWNRRGTPPPYWYDLSKIIYMAYKEIEEFGEDKNYNQLLEIRGELLNLRGEDLARGLPHDLLILKETFVGLVSNQQLVEFAKLVEPSAYTEAIEKFTECIKDIIDKLELGKPLRGKCRALGY